MCLQLFKIRMLSHGQERPVGIEGDSPCSFGCPMAERGVLLAASSALKTMSVQSPSLSGLQGAAVHKAFTQLP